MLNTTITMDAEKSLYEQIYAHIKKEIQDGKMSAGERLPSARKLAENLSVSRNTIDAAYMQLELEGYIEAKPRKGFFVCDTFLMYKIDMKKEITTEDYIGEKEDYIDFSPAGVDMSAFPYNKWRKLYKECMITDNAALFQSGDAKGDIKFRKSIAEYLYQSRGIHCDAEHIVIGAGSDYLLLLLSNLLPLNKKMAMENPTYPQAYEIFSRVGFDISGVPVDHHGMIVDELKKTDAKVVYVTPTQQFPMGMVMSVGRRMQLLNLMEERDGYIIEDDYDSEFRYVGRPVPALQSMDANDRVIYMGTFSKAIAPAIRVSYMVLPDQLLRSYKEKLPFLGTTVSRIDQAVLTEFMQSGAFEKHLNKMRAVYKSKRDFLIGEIKKRGWPVKIMGDQAGLHIILQVKDHKTEEDLIAAAKEKGVKIYGLSSYLMKDLKAHMDGEVTIILGFAKLSEEEIIKGLDRLGQVF